MELRTTFEIPPSELKISYYDPVMFIGSCFATSIGNQFEIGHMPVMINPAGTVYNPVSVCNTISSITEKRVYNSDDLYNYQGNWVSFNHSTDFTCPDLTETLDTINRRSAEAGSFLSTARFLFVTFGTANVYKWSGSGMIVSNCHKIPAREFKRELLSVDEITALWETQLDTLDRLYPGLKVVFTISPVRHWKDGAHGNQVSKSVLFLSVEKLLSHPSGPSYFPAYELVMDDLRDYRFFSDDMLHISDIAINYIWQAFCRCYFEKATADLWNEISNISRALLHKIKDKSSDQTKLFAGKIITMIDSVLSRNPGVDLSKERKYFLALLQN